MLKAEGAESRTYSLELKLLAWITYAEAFEK